MKPKEKSIQTTSINFQTLVWGKQGEPIVLLHGFPETPHIFDELAPKLVEKGYQVFAPYLPGYGKSTPTNKENSITHLEDLADAIGAFIVKLSDGKKAIKLVGHDWGAVAAYVTAAKYPYRVARLITMAVPPLPLFVKSLLTHPAQWMRSSYILLFQLRANIPENVTTKFNHLYLRHLCRQWSGKAKKSLGYFSDNARLFNELGSLTHPLGYYRGLLPLLSGSVAKWFSSQKLAFTKLKVPTTILVGSEDGCNPSPIYEGFEHCVDAPSSLTIVNGAGHFLPIDAPEAIASKL